MFIYEGELTLREHLRRVERVNREGWKREAASPTRARRPFRKQFGG